MRNLSPVAETEQGSHSRRFHSPASARSSSRSCRVSSAKHGNLATRVGEAPPTAWRLPPFPPFQRGSVSLPLATARRLPPFPRFQRGCVSLKPMSGGPWRALRHARKPWQPKHPFRLPSCEVLLDLSAFFSLHRTASVFQRLPSAALSCAVSGVCRKPVVASCPP